jgi:HK97 family phage prohead protease
MKVKTPDNYEARSLQGTVEVRKREDGGATIRGIAAVFDSLSENLGGFREQIAPGAFTDTDMLDVRGLFNHDANFVLGRTTSKTVRLKQTNRGLEYEIDLPDTATIRDLVLAPIERGDVDQSSFGFIVGPGNDSWDEDAEGRMIRTIRKVAELFDVSPVTFPAYRDTTVGARSMNDWQSVQSELAAQAKAELDERKKRAVQIENFERRAELPGK